MISGADGAHSKRNGKYRDVLNSLVGEQSHVNEVDEEEEEFQFLSGLDTSYSKTTRVHVLKKYQKQRRERAKQRKLRSSGFLASVRDEPSATRDNIKEPCRQLVKISPQSSLSAQRSDPFHTLPLLLTTREQLLADHYVNVLIPQYYAGSPRDPFNINKVTLFPNAIQDSVAVAGALTFAAHHVALLQNRKLDSEFFNLRSRSIRLLNSRISNPVQRTSDATIYAILGQIVLGTEFYNWPRKVVSRVELASHIRGIRLIIQARGGMNAFKGNRWLDWILNWVDVECAGEIFAGLTSNEQSTLITSEVEAQAIDNRTLPLSQTFHSNDLSPSVEDLALLYENWYNVARRRTDANAAALFDQSQLSRRLFADRSATGRQHKLIRLATLIQLNLLVWELEKSSSEKVKDNLESTIRAVSREETKSIGSTTHLLWTLITARATASINDHERLWTTTRMLRIIYRCSPGLQKRLERTLLYFLTSKEQSSVWLSWSPVRFTLDMSKEFSQLSPVA